MLVKIQRPLAPKDAPWLIYNEDRSFEAQIHRDKVPNKVRRSTAVVPKAYWDVVVQNKIIISWGERARTQTW
jgi:hypothetical protein